MKQNTPSTVSSEAAPDAVSLSEARQRPSGSGSSAVMVVFTFALMMPVARARSCVDCAAAQAGNISTIWTERTPRPARYRDSSNPLFPPPTTSTSLSL